MNKNLAVNKSDSELDKIKTLRGMTGAGLMNCKEALKLKNGDLDQAVQYLKEKGLAIANKKSSRLAKEGRIESYIHHNSRIGVLVEINCETDFVAQTDELKAFAKEVALQIAASDSLRFVNREDLSDEQLNSLKVDLGPAESEKVINEKLKECFLLEQISIKHSSQTIKDRLQQTIAKLGENIKIARFIRYELGQ
uniref:Elongation factor Ts, mitochondrial n=1 Tax=Eustigmatophyceae sp. Chic 10/23 P-6w TaxID=1446905 RepID=A0A451FME2_9STRA|nr:translation elongation factor Ts [Eustigmatophyceae sp. Chic 10/23 P-6w]QAA11570.1 translation elongation factor Ts [Eustigmatophyceae sp. Chic 10/23 P-6w]